MMATPSRNTRTPSSARTVNVPRPAGNETLRVQRAEKLSTGRPAGPPAPPSYRTVASHGVRVAGAVSVMLEKYCAENWPGEQGTSPLIVKGFAPDTWLSGLRT